LQNSFVTGIKPIKDQTQNLFEEALSRDGKLVLDGGLATELETQGRDIGTKLWSAGLLRTNPLAIVEAHLAFLEAGAEIITSASYQASRGGFMSTGLSADAADNLIVSSVDLACTARQRFLDSSFREFAMPIVAASIGPYGAAMHDGSEYTGIYNTGEKSLLEFHGERLQLLDASAADVLACETIPSEMEAGVLHDLLLHVQSPAWVSFCCRDDRCISDGTPLQVVSAMFRDHPRVVALGINCTAPDLVLPLIEELKKAAPDKAIVVYPNSGETYDAADNSWHGRVSMLDWTVEAGNWVNAGAGIVGGCCRVGPKHIIAIRDKLRTLDSGQA
jgi:homocysteine S-methyltransferase